MMGDLLMPSAGHAQQQLHTHNPVTPDQHSSSDMLHLQPCQPAIQVLGRSTDADDSLPV
jgi:hypothetical protein